MIWIDLLAVAIVLGAALFESRRQLGSTLFDMLALLASAKLAGLLSPRLAHSLALTSSPDYNRAIALALLFVIIAAVLLLLAKLIQDAAELSMDALDSAAGVLFGLVSGIAFAHVVLMVILTANPPTTEWGKAVRTRPAVQELVHFRGYHLLVSWMRHAGE
jgi:uncharacterized membrane protein required for colicin V production